MASSQPTARPGAVVAVLAFAGTTAAIMQTLVTPLIAELPASSPRPPRTRRG